MSLFKRVVERCFRDANAAGSVSDRPNLLKFDPADPDFIANPYPYLANLRKHAPLFRSDFGPWVLTRYEDVLAALSDARLGNAPAPYAVVNQKNRERYLCADVANNLIAFMDPPEHEAARRLLTRAFHQYMRQGLPDLRKIADEIARGLPEQGRYDILQLFATPFSIEVILRIFGLPFADAGRLKSWTDRFFYLFTQIPSTQIRDALDQALAEFHGYMRAALDERRISPRDDFLSSLVQATEAADGPGISESGLVDNCMLIFADGIENVDSGIANSLLCLLRDPRRWSALCAGRADVGVAVDECLRFESPAQFIGRVALTDVQWHGQTIRKGSAVLLVLAAANLDPQRFENPERFEMRRSPNPYLSFGRGKHSCLGGSLVKLEMEAAIRALLANQPRMQLGEDKEDWQFRPGHRWLASLPVQAAG